jgi:hypothetical protein
MKRYICDWCKQNYKVEEDLEIPVGTVVGSAIGLMAGMLTGHVLVLAAVGLFAGLSADKIRCERCGSDKGLNMLLDQKVNKLGEKIYRAVPRMLYDPSKHYEYDKIEGHFIEAEVDPTDVELQMPADESFDYDVSFDVDTGFESDMGEGDFGDWGADAGVDGDFGTGDFGTGDGGDFGTGDGGDFGTGSGGEGGNT